MRTAYLVRLGLSAVLMTLLLGACGSSGGTSSRGSTSASEAAATGTSAATSSSSAAGSSAKPGVTAPGTGLSVGQTATVTYTPLTSSGNGKPRTLKVTVASIRTGTSADLKALDVSGAPAGAVPQYATVSVTNLGPLSIDVNSTSDAIQGIDHGGKPAGPGVDNRRLPAV